MLCLNFFRAFAKVPLYGLLLAAMTPSLEAHGQLTGPIDVDHLRRQVMSQLPPAIQQLAAPSISATTLRAGNGWGIQVYGVPPTLSKNRQDLNAGEGLIIVSVEEDSPASASGLKAGMVILKVDRQAIRTATDLPPLEDTISLEVLTEEGMRSIQISPRKSRLPSFDLLALLNSNFRLPDSATSAFAGKAASAPGESVSVSNHNGLVTISAVLTTEQGNRKVELSGTRAEVNQQIDQLPADLAVELRRRVDF